MVVEVLVELGGVATRATLVRLTTRAAVDRALAAGDVVVDARGRYALPHTDVAVRAAHRLSGVLCLRSAAAHWGWEQKVTPARPDVTVPKNRKLSVERCQGVTIHRASLHADDIDGVATCRERTLVDCLRILPFDEALAIADSALRCGDITSSRLRALARDARGPGTRAIRRVARVARDDAANAFESVLRAIALDVGLEVRPQVPIHAPDFLGRPDLVDEERRIILEADSFAWHGDRSALRRDARRYDEFVVNGWIVLRFAWEDVMHDQDWVREVLTAVMRVAERTQGRICSCGAA